MFWSILWFFKNKFCSVCEWVWSRSYAKPPQLYSLSHTYTCTYKLTYVHSYIKHKYLHIIHIACYMQLFSQGSEFSAYTVHNCALYAWKYGSNHIHVHNEFNNKQNLHLCTYFIKKQLVTLLHSVVSHAAWMKPALGIQALEKYT